LHACGKDQLKNFLAFFLWGLCIYGYQGSILFLFLFSENCANAPALHGEIFEGKKKRKKEKKLEN